MPHSPGVLDFAFVLVNSVVNLPDKRGEFSFWGEVGCGYSKYRRTVINPTYQRFFGGRCDVHQATKKTPTKFFYPKQLQNNKVQTQKIFIYFIYLFIFLVTHKTLHNMNKRC